MKRVLMAATAVTLLLVSAWIVTAAATYRTSWFTFDGGVNLRKYPGIGNGIPPDHDKIAPGLSKHPHRIGSAKNISVTDHRDGRLLFDRSNQ